MGTVNGAAAVPAWRNKIGKIKPGYRADLVLLKPGLRLRPLNDIVHQLVFCEAGQSVDTVFVDGKMVLESGRLIGVDEDSLARRVDPIGKRMHRLYRVIKKKTDRSELATRALYKKALKDKRSRIPFNP
jgi:cytosine/adenosine deaminase-related metal-dependent hydrolase